jgi:Holliday junction resolvase
MSESDIQKQIIKTHKNSGWFVTKIIQSTTNGIPDIFMAKNGRVVFVEVKSKSGKSLPLQAYVQAQIISQGVEVFVTDDENFKL